MMFSLRTQSLESSILTFFAAESGPIRYVDDKGKVVLLMWVNFHMDLSLAAQIRPLPEIPGSIFCL